MHREGLGQSKVDVDKTFLFYKIPIKIWVIFNICLPKNSLEVWYSMEMDNGNCVVEINGANAQSKLHSANA